MRAAGTVKCAKRNTVPESWSPSTLVGSQSFYFNTNLWSRLVRFSCLPRCYLSGWWHCMYILVVSLACVSMALGAISHDMELKPFSHFIGGCLSWPGLKHCLGPCTLKFNFSLLWAYSSITWVPRKPIQCLRHSISCAACFFFSFCTSAHFLPLPSSPLLHLSHSNTFTVILSLPVSLHPAA